MGVAQGVSCVICIGDWTRTVGEGSGLNGEGGGRGGTGLSSDDDGEKASEKGMCCVIGEASLRLCTSGLAMVSFPFEIGTSKEGVEEFRSANSLLGVLSRLTLVVVGSSEYSGSRDGGGTRLLASALFLTGLVGEARLGGSSDARFTFCQSSSTPLAPDPDPDDLWLS